VSQHGEERKMKVIKFNSQFGSITAILKTAYQAVPVSHGDQIFGDYYDALVDGKLVGSYFVSRKRDAADRLVLRSDKEIAQEIYKQLYEQIKTSEANWAYHEDLSCDRWEHEEMILAAKNCDIESFYKLNGWKALKTPATPAIVYRCELLAKGYTDNSVEGFGW
jgi:hypothetical protein